MEESGRSTCRPIATAIGACFGIGLIDDGRDGCFHADRPVCLPHGWKHRGTCLDINHLNGGVESALMGSPPVFTHVQPLQVDIDHLLCPQGLARSARSSFCIRCSFHCREFDQFFQLNQRGNFVRRQVIQDEARQLIRLRNQRAGVLAVLDQDQHQRLAIWR